MQHAMEALYKAVMFLALDAGAGAVQSIERWFQPDMTISNHPSP
jgi:hypothetical protein